MAVKGTAKNLVKRLTAALAAAALVFIALAPDAKATVYWGSRGSEVHTVQTKLKQWGYFSGTVDGVFGQETYNAVVSFQRKNGLTADLSLIHI